jgi:GNAT superfamily N-acetyltransferase
MTSMKGTSMKEPDSIELVNLRDLRLAQSSRFQVLFDSYVKIYNDAFSDASEREDPNEWLNRWDNAPASPQPSMHLVLALDPQQFDTVLGGIAFEFYRESGCALITYIAVDPASRSKGIARKLGSAALDELGAITQLSGAKLNGVFCESQMPGCIHEASEREFAKSRQEILMKLGAVQLDLPYVQPALVGGDGRSHHLMLMAFRTKATMQEPSKEIILTFLNEFYRALGVENPESDDDYKRTVDYLRRGLSRTEVPIMNLADVAVCIHLASTAINYSKPRYDRETCPVFRSMELDLLSASFQTMPPFETHCHTQSHQAVYTDEFADFGIELDLIFPRNIEFISEGRQVRLFCPSPIRRAKAYLARTIFFNSNVTIWHVVLRPVVGKHFTEYDIIKLIHLYDGNAENTTLARDLRFAVDGKIPCDISQLPKLLLASISSESADDFNEAHKDAKPVGGTCQWLTGKTKADTTLASVADKAMAHFSNQDVVFADVNGNTLEGQWLKAACGVLTGIFDFDELDGNEVRDTLFPVIDEKTQMIWINRRTVLQISEDDRPMKSCIRTVGISPYLILPHAAVLFAEQLLNLAEAASDTVLESRRNRIGKLQSAHDTIHRSLRRLWLPNVFNYKTERTLFGESLQNRGVADRFQSLERQMQEMQYRLETAWERRRGYGQAIIAAIVTLLAVFQIAEAIHQISGTRSWLIVFVIAVLLSVATIILGLFGNKKLS